MTTNDKTGGSAQREGTLKSEAMERSRNTQLTAPARFFADVDSVMSLIVHRHGRDLPEDVKQEATRLYYEARNVYAGPIPTTVQEVEKVEREMAVKPEHGLKMPLRRESHEFFDADKHYVFSVLDSMRLSKAQRNDFRDFILRALNAHEGLVNSLKRSLEEHTRALGFLEARVKDGQPVSVWRDETAEIVEVLRAALAVAEGEAR